MWIVNLTWLSFFNQWNNLDLSSIFEADHFFGWHVMYFGFSTLLTLHFTTTCVILTLVWDRQGWALKRDGQLLVAAVFPIPRHWQYYHFLEMWITSFGEWWCCHWLRSEKWFSNFQLFTVQIIIFWIANTIQKGSSVQKKVIDYWTLSTIVDNLGLTIFIAVHRI